ncbi:unnamed protein product [Coffea canephora]|uniref:FBD domain-containing protein n=1 Tax=Coffea canephora TaxID=49390 RepID=A0A068UWT0_COFCA|nr:unnamed protein product [Coffea canephora]
MKKKRNSTTRAFLGEGSTNRVFAFRECELTDLAFPKYELSELAFAECELIDLAFLKCELILGMRELVEDEVDWISCFPHNGTCLESLIFDCVDSPINFEALERLVVKSPSLKKLRLNRHVTIVQLYCLMVRAPQLTHLGTGSFGPGEIVAQGEQEPDYVSAFAACKSLVCLSGFREINAHYLPAIVPVCANLTSLNLSYATISTEQLKSFIYHCHKLQTLWVLDSVCDEGLQAVAATCKDLHEPVQVSFGRD